MIHEFEQYHGVVLRSIIVNSRDPVLLEAADGAGRLNSYKVNSSVAVHIKHSTKRLSPWNFSFTVAQLKELVGLKRECRVVWLVFVCGPDGIVSVPLHEFVSVTETRPGRVASIRIDRSPRSMYRVYGNAGQLATAKPNGVGPLIETLYEPTGELA